MVFCLSAILRKAPIIIISNCFSEFSYKQNFSVFLDFGVNSTFYEAQLFTCDKKKGGLLKFLTILIQRKFFQKNVLNINK